jgi:CheY-like chemotaxis protein
VADLPVELTADGVRVRQVLLNLLSNAIKFTRTGGVTVMGSYDGHRLRIAVTDTGIGIAADSRDRLFQRFSQVDGSITRRYGGTGLGLAICKGLVELMGGEIGVTSSPGDGSTFWFTVPAHPAEAANPELVAEAPRSIDGARVLVVDDEPQNRELIGLMLEAAGCQVSFAEDGVAAVERAQSAPFDLVLMDIQMPRVDGPTAARAIQRQPGPNQKTPILALSANVLPEHVEACRRAGMLDHIAKPVSSGGLLSKAAYWIERSPSAAAL